MTTPAPLCPDCSAPLDGGPTCASCGLRLTGPDAARLWLVDRELAALGARRQVLLAERGPLLARLRPAGVGAPRAGASTVVPAPAARERTEWTPHRVQNTLLGLGGLLLAVAAAVFAAVTYDRLGAGGRALVLLALTALVAGAVPVAVRRGLSATAETLTAVALALCALDAYGLRRLGVGGDADLRSYLAVTTAVLSATALAFAAVVPVRTARIAAVVLAQLPLGFVLWRVEASEGVTALALAGLAAADLGVVAALRRGRLARTYARSAAACAVAVAGASLLAVGVGAADEPGRTALALAVLAAVAAGGSGLVAGLDARRLLSGLPVLLGAAAALVLAAPRLEPGQLPLVAAAVAVLAVQAAALLPAPRREGPVGGALLVGAGALAAVAVPVAEALVLPLGWLAEPWTLAPGSGARAALSPEGPWTGTVVVTVVVAAAALTAGSAGLVLHRLRAGVAAAGVLAVAAVALLPLGLATSYGAALAVLLVAAAGALVAGLVLPSEVRAGLLGAATALALLAATWSTAGRTATLVVLPAVTLLFAVAAALPARLPRVGAAAATALAGAAGTATLAAVGAARGLAAEQVGPLLLAGPAVLLAGSAAPALGRERRLAAEASAAALCLPAVALTAGDAGWLSWTLALTGVLALVAALRPDRRGAALAGALLLAASSWVRLVDADVTAPEPYVVPLGLVVLALGHARRRAEPGTTSFAAYGAGLTLLLVPSLLASLDDATLRRPLLLGLAALGVLLVGARAHLRAPIVLGGVVLAVDALQLLAPYAAALPRWLSLGAAGALLVGVGATYEQRLRELGRLRRGFDALG